MPARMWRHGIHAFFEFLRHGLPESLEHMLAFIHEHHDFFLALHHHSASPALSRLVAKYLMTARMWRQGIHAFFELLRRRLPESLEHMLAFIYIGYSVMTLLYKIVSTSKDTWIECIGTFLN